MPLRTPAFWQKKGVLSNLLLPFSMAYAQAAMKRIGNATPHHIKPKVLCIGNLVAGGAGKTPIARAIGEWANEKSIKACFLSRGYGGKLQKVWVDPTHHNHIDVGDEPLLLVRTLPTLISADRALGGKMAEEAGYDLVIMDDGYQNPGLHKDASLVVIDSTYGFGNGRCLPAGPMREPAPFGLARASAVLLTHRAGSTTRQTPALPKDLPTPHVHLGSHYSEPIKDQRLVAFTGIGRPESFFATLRAGGGEVIHQGSFPDHHNFTEKELQELAAIALKGGAKLITTAKDAVRLSQHWQSEIIIADLTVTWDDELAFHTLLETLLGM